MTVLLSPWCLASCGGVQPADEEYVAAPPEGEEEGEESASQDTIEEHFQKADKLLADENGPEALLELQEVARRLDPNDPRMLRYHERIGSVHFAENDFTAAKESYTRAIKLSKDLRVEDAAVADVYTGMGLCLLRERNNAYAAKFFRKALSLDPPKATRKAIEAQLQRIESPAGP
ncbi:MAG: hypothetical protein HY924_10850 [Elusimicrobia bacterium]|nr:hypothetical protein [Elusimicrobiota bacterium]